jgi:hypothetical protein
VKEKEKESMRCACKSLRAWSLLVCSHIAAAGGSPEQAGRRNEAAGEGGEESDYEKILGQSVMKRLSCATGIERLRSSKGIQIYQR